MNVESGRDLDVLVSEVLNECKRQCISRPQPNMLDSGVYTQTPFGIRPAIMWASMRGGEHVSGCCKECEQSLTQHTRVCRVSHILCLRDEGQEGSRIIGTLQLCGLPFRE